MRRKLLLSIKYSINSNNNDIISISDSVMLVSHLTEEHNGIPFVQ